jgi:hypothetical protein
MHAPITSTGPQTGYAVVVLGTVFQSTERRPADALADITTQINLANGARRRTGLELLTPPRAIAQLSPLYAHANPQLDALLAGEQPPAAQISCSSNAQPIGDVRAYNSTNASRMAAGYSVHAVRA